jgi:hypothetical protein
MYKLLEAIIVKQLYTYSNIDYILESRETHRDSEGKRMGKVVKKVCYLREDQVEKMIECIYKSYKGGIRGFNESSLCRVAIDLLFSLDLDIHAFNTEEELLEACRDLVQ